MKIKDFYQKNKNLGKAFKFHLRENQKKVIALDLRCNPGGSVQQMIDVATAIQGVRVIVDLEGPGGFHLSLPNKEDIKLKHAFVIFCDEYTASSAERLVAYLREFGFCVVIGEPTTGKNQYGTEVEKIKRGEKTLPDGTVLQGEYKVSWMISSGRVDDSKPFNYRHQPDILVDWDMIDMEVLMDVCERSHGIKNTVKLEEFLRSEIIKIQKPIVRN